MDNNRRGQGAAGGVGGAPGAGRGRGLLTGWLRPGLSLLAGVIILLIGIVYQGGNEDDQAFPMLQKPGNIEESLGVLAHSITQLEGIIQIYKFTESVEEKFSKLRGLDPRVELREKVSAITEDTKALTDRYTDMLRILPTKSAEERSQLIEDLHDRTEAVQEEYEEMLELVGELKTKPIVEAPAPGLEKALKAEFHNFTNGEKYLDELVESVSALQAEHVLPEGHAREFREDQVVINGLPVLDRKIVEGLAKLLKELHSSATEKHEQQGQHSNKKGKNSEKSMNAKKKLAQQIPVYIAQHTKTLQAVPLIITTRIGRLGRQIERLDSKIAKYATHAQKEVRDEFFEFLAENLEELKHVKASAEKMHRKYSEMEMEN